MKGRLMLAAGWLAWLTTTAALAFGPPKTLAETERLVAARYPQVALSGRAALAERLAGAEPPLLLDVRPAAEFDVSHLPGAVRVDPDADLPDVLAAVGDALAGRDVVVYCSVGERSGRLAARVQPGLVAAGARSVANLEGGLFGWANDERPLVDAAGPTRRVHPYSRAWGRLVRDATRLAR